MPQQPPKVHAGVRRCTRRANQTMSGFFQSYADWVSRPVPLPLHLASRRHPNGNASDLVAGHLAGSAADNGFHTILPVFLGHNPFAAFQQSQAFQPGRFAAPTAISIAQHDNYFHRSNVHGGVPGAPHPSVSVQPAMVTTKGSPEDISNKMPSVQTPVTTNAATDDSPNRGLAQQTTVITNTAPANNTSNNTVTMQIAVARNVIQAGVVAVDVEAGVEAAEQTDADTRTTLPDVAVTTTVAVKHKSPKKKARITPPPEMQQAVEDDDVITAPNFREMEEENATILGQDAPSPWKNGVARFNADRGSAAKVLAWLVENTSRKLSIIATDALTLDGFHNWDAVHAGIPNDERQLQHTFVIARAQRRRALKVIPGLKDLVDASKAAIASLRLKDAPEKLEWLTGHILNQGDVNARFEWHQDTNEERKETGGRRDRRVFYSAIVKLNRGGCTSMQICGEPEVYYYSPEGSGVIFRSDLHHRTEKAEQGVWKVAMFFGVFL